MTAFTLNQQVKLASVNPRAEAHGEERIPAYDLKFEAQCPASALAHFHPQLADLLYTTPADPDLADDPEQATAPRFAKMSGFKWDYETTGNTLTVDYGLGGDSNIVLGDVRLDKFSLLPQNGGTVLIGFRAIVHPKTEHVGLLCERIQQNIDLLIEPAREVTGDLLVGKPKKTKEDAQALFTEGADVE